ncbi:hypothetical protein [Spirosoma sp.]|uniref:hypothetical protein n=1 Tax=Spirosoma sp. TaxID=1899569 RepID=UPI0026373034|nr:hypothetical protein [Spirosoma sp.]MCX6217627.1 hypothetical protein [Spirosoma sp.]
MSFTIESNMEGILVNLAKAIQLTDDSMEEILFDAGSDAVVIVAHRVQQSGLAASGNRLQTKASLRMGAYSAAHAKRRAERGRQIAYKDLTMDGTLMKDWQVLTTGPTEVGIGFSDPKQSVIADGLEEYQGGVIFGLSDQEQDKVALGIMDSIEDRLRQ